MRAAPGSATCPDTVSFSRAGAAETQWQDGKWGGSSSLGDSSNGTHNEGNGGARRTAELTGLKLTRPTIRLGYRRATLGPNCVMARGCSLMSRVCSCSSRCRRWNHPRDDHAGSRRDVWRAVRQEPERLSCERNPRAALQKSALGRSWLPRAWFGCNRGRYEVA